MRTFLSASSFVGNLLAGSVFVASTLVSNVAHAEDPPLKRGAAALEKSDYAAAEKTLGDVKGADEGAAKLLLSRAALEQGKYDVAEKLATQAMALGKKLEGITARAMALRAQGKEVEAIRLLEPLKTEKNKAARRGKLLLGELLIDTGHRADANDPLMQIADEYNDDTINDNDPEGLAMVGRATYLLRAFKNANQVFKEAERAEKKANRTNPDRNLWFAELFFDKYDTGHAEELVKELLTVAPKRADALVLLGRIKVEQSFDFDAAEKMANEALGVNPKLTGAFALRAGLALRDLDTAAAEKAIGEGLKTDPSDLELRTLLATSRFLADDSAGYESAKKDVLARNPEFATFYQVVSDYAEWEHRYDDMVRMMTEAVKIDPEDGKSWATLGFWQSRGGNETDGLASLKKSWTKDKYNVRAYNTLNLYEKVIPVEYDLVSLGALKIRYPKDEKAILERYVPRLLGEAYASMKSRYKFLPTAPTQVELYGSREQFSERTSGLPNIGIHGVCFGRVVAAISPKTEPFNWGNVLWHELGHVFAIQLSKNHVPRWFTEGLSEYETIARRPEWHRELDPQLYLAIKRGSLPGAVDMNRAFTRAENAEDVTVAYYAASQMLLFTVEQFGMPAVNKALALWGKGERTADVLEHAFGTPAAEYDRQFRAWAMARLVRYEKQYVFDDRAKPLEATEARVKEKPQDARARFDHALALVKSRKGEEAVAEINEALKLDPKLPDALALQARMQKGQERQATLEKLLSSGGDGYESRILLAGLAHQAKDAKTERAHLEAAAAFDPSQPDAIRSLLELALREKRTNDEVPLLRALAPLDQHDGKVFRRLLEKLVEAKLWKEARATGESAMFVDVRNGGTHLNYARALLALGDKPTAIFELESVLVAESTKHEASTAHYWLSLLNAGDAKEHGREARKIEPENPLFVEGLPKP